MNTLNASQIARRAAMRRLETDADIQAVTDSLQPMLSNIEQAAGMVPGANVLKPNLFVESSDPSVNYMDALRVGLPDYVNAYRAYKAEQDAKKNKQGESTGAPGFNFDYEGLAKLLRPYNYGLNPTSMIDFSTPVPSPNQTKYYPSPYGPTPDVRTSPAYRTALNNLKRRTYGSMVGTGVVTK